MKWSHITACAAILILPACTAPPIPDGPTAIHTAQPQPEPAAQLKQKIDKLVTQLADEKFAIREAADEELRNMLLQDTENFNTIFSSLKRHLDSAVDPEVRIRLKRITRPCLEFVEPLIKSLTDPVAWVRQAAAEALAELEDPKAVVPLIKALGDTDADVRAMAASALGSFKDARAVEPLVGRLADVDKTVRQAAATALIEIDMLIDVRWRKVLEEVAQLVDGQIVPVGSNWLKIVPMPKVTIKVHDKDLGLVLNQIATLYGVNIVIAPDVVGKVSVNLKNVPWRTAFDTIVKTLGYVVIEEDDNTLRAVRPEE